MVLLRKIILFFIYYFQTWADLCRLINVEHLTNTYKRALWQNLVQIVISRMTGRMDTFVKGGNEMWKMQAKERIQSQTRIVSASAMKRALDLLSVCPPTHLKMFR